MDSATRQKATEVISREIWGTSPDPCGNAAAIVEALTAAGLSVIDTSVQFAVPIIPRESTMQDMVRRYERHLDNVPPTGRAHVDAMHQAYEIMRAAHKSEQNGESPT